MTTSRTLIAAIVGGAMMIGAPILASPASAQAAPTSNSVVPVIMWGVTGAVIGAIAWPMIVGGAAASAVPAGIMGLNAYLNTGAAVGAVAGGGGYLLAR